MEKLSIYTYQDYKKFLRDWVERAPNGGRGLRKELAKAVGCQTPFITHVLSGEYHFSAEQADAAARWLGFGEEEAEFFVLLVLRQRAGTRSLENLLQRQLDRRKEARAVLKKRLNLSADMTLEDQLVYYSQWHYAAVHMACHIPELQDPKVLRRHLGLDAQQVHQALDFLVMHRLLEKTRSGYRVLRPTLHLGNDSPLLPQYHSQWRVKAMEAFQKKRAGDLSYSGVASLSREDYDWARERLSQFLEELVARLRSSKDEKLAAICFDLFEV